MSEQVAVELRRFSVMGAGRVRDVVVDSRTRLGDVLDELGLATTTEALSPGGARIPRGATLVGAGITDGAMLVAVDGASLAPARVRAGGALSAAHAPGSRTGATAALGDAAPDGPAGREARTRRERRAAIEAASRSTSPASPPTATATSTTAAAGSAGLSAPLMAATAAVLAVLAALALLLPGTTGGGGLGVLAAGGGAVSLATVAGGVLLLASLVLAGAADEVRAEVVAATGAAVGAGLLALGLTTGLAAGSAHLAVAAAGLGAVVSAVTGRGGTPLSRRVARTVITVGLLLAGGAVLAVVASWPAAVLAVVAVAVTVPLARTLPDVVVDVEPTAMVDLDRLATTAWTPRPRRTPVRWQRVLREDVDGPVRDAVAHQRLVLAGALGAVVLAGTVLVVAAPGPHLATTILLATVGAGLGLVARRYLDRTDRWLLRAAGLVAVAAAGMRVAERAPEGIALAVVAGLAVVALALVLLAPVVGRGWTSLGLGRLADVLEALCVAAALPLTIWAAGLIPWIRALVA